MTRTPVRKTKKNSTQRGHRRFGVKSSTTVRLTFDLELTSKDVAQLLSEDPSSLSPIPADVIVSRKGRRRPNGKPRCCCRCKKPLSFYNRGRHCHSCGRQLLPG